MVTYKLAIAIRGEEMTSVAHIKVMARSPWRAIQFGYDWVQDNIQDTAIDGVAVVVTGEEG